MALAVLVAVGAFIRLYDVRHSLWLDELHTSWCVAGDFDDIAPRARMGNYSPVYFWLVWGVTKVFGLTELFVRLASLIAGIALIPAVYLLARRFTGSPAAGLLAATLVALDGTLFGWYSQEARPYALIQLLSVLHVWAFYELVQRPRWKLRAAFISLTVAMFYLHYTSLLILTGELVWYGVHRARLACANWNVVRPGVARHYTWLQLAVDLAIAGICCRPAVSHLAEIFVRREQWAQFVEPQPLYAVVSLFAIAPAALGLMLLAGTIAGLRRLVAGKEASRSRVVEPSAGMVPLLLSWLAVPLLLTWLATYTSVAHLFFPRYLLFASAALPILAAVGIALLRRPALQTVYFLLAVALLQLSPASRDHYAGAVAGYYQSGSFTQHFSEDWRGAVAEIRARDPDGRYPVYLSPGLIESRQSSGMNEELPRAYLLFPLHSIYWLPRAQLLETTWDGLAHVPAGADDIRKAEGAWLLARTGRSDDRFLLRRLKMGVSLGLQATHQFKSVRGLSGLTLVHVRLD
jgi:mannosyltransferase